MSKGLLEQVVQMIRTLLNDVIELFGKQKTDTPQKPEPAPVEPSKPLPIPAKQLVSEPYRIDLGHRSNWEKTVTLPAVGKFVQEAHYATVLDKFEGDRAFPKTETEGIAEHLERSLKALQREFPSVTFNDVYTNKWRRMWTPPENGQAGQGARGYLKPQAWDEMWQANMMFKSGELPPMGTKFLMTANGKMCVVNMGYEVGPGDVKYLGGATTEVHWYLGTSNDSEIELHYLADQTVVCGPIEGELVRPEEDDSHIPEVGENSERVKIMQRRLNAHGASLVIDGDFGPKTKLAVSLFQKMHGLLGSGIPGPKTMALLATDPIIRRDEPNRNREVLLKAASQIGVKEVRGSGNSAIVVEYHRYANRANNNKQPDSVPWCASFVCWALETVGMTSTNSMMARSFESWGKSSLMDPLPGDIVTFYRNGKSSGSGHIGFLVKKQGNTVWILGGNQSDSVNITKYSTDKMTDIRRSTKADYTRAQELELSQIAEKILAGEKVQEPGSVV